MTRTRRLPAWIALVALVFAAVSPALAAALFADRPEISARILGLPAAPAPQQAADCHDEAGPAAPREHEDHEEHDHHASHGVFCSFCLVASSLLTLPSAPGLTLEPPASGSVADEPAAAPRVARRTAGYQPRGPPAP